MKQVLDQSFMYIFSHTGATMSKFPGIKLIEVETKLSNLFRGASQRLKVAKQKKQKLQTSN